MQTDKKLFASTNNEVCLSINKKLLGSNKPTQKNVALFILNTPKQSSDIHTRI